MVLIPAWTSLIVIALWAAISGAHAADFQDYQVIRGDCPVYQRVGDKWQKSPHPSFPVGSVIKGVPYPNASWVVVRSGQDVLALGDSCLSEVLTEQRTRSRTPVRRAAPQAPVQPQTQSHARPAVSGGGATESSWFFYVGGMSWQEPFTLTSPDNRSYKLLATNMAACPGFGKSWRINPKWSLTMAGCFLYGGSELGTPTGVASPEIEYDATGVTVYGLHTGPRLMWHPGSDSIGVGFSLPLMYRTGNWPEPTGGYKLDGKSGLRIGASLDFLIRLGKIELVPRAGFLGSFTYFHWGVDLGYRF